MTVDECWIVETSKDGERWRFFGKAWKQPDGAILLHAAPVRSVPADRRRRVA